MGNEYIGPSIGEDWVKRAKPGMIRAARKQNLIRRVTSINPIGNSIGILNWEFDRIDEISEAELTWSITPGSEDQVGAFRDSIKIPVLKKEISIDGRDLEAARLKRKNLPLYSTNSAAYQVANLENQTGFIGYTTDGNNYSVNGFYKKAGQKITDTYDFSTPGKAVEAVAAMTEEFKEDEIYGPFNLMLPTKQHTELSISILGKTYNGTDLGASQTGRDELGMVQRLLAGGSVIEVPWLETGTSMMMTPAGYGHHEMIVAKDLSLETYLNPKDKSLWARVFECVTPVVYEPDAIGIFTNI